MRGPRASASIVATTALIVAGVIAPVAGAATRLGADSRSARADELPNVGHGRESLVPGLPHGVPKAALLPEPRLPEPSHRDWPFPSSFSRTSGTGRLAGGALLWTDFLFDDHGAAAPSGFPLASGAETSSLAPTQGLASYPSADDRNNGADIFRAAVGLTAAASYWRVDWTTLVDPNVPIAEWTFDTDDNAKTGTSRWAADAGVNSPGIDTALVVSAKAVQLVDLRTGNATDVLSHGGTLTVDRASRSFVVRVPRTLLPVTGDWRIRLASGVASADGRSFAAPDYSQGIAAPEAALQRLPRVFNVTFRTVGQEPPVYRDGSTDAQVAAFGALLAGTPVDSALGLDGQTRFITGNFWMEDHQADALASGDVAPFSRVVSWARLARRTTTPAPQPRGYSNRWYVTRLDLGQGVVNNPMTSPNGDLRPNYLSRVQPYAVYVPRHVSLRARLPLTWILHSLGVNLNQYGALDPRLLQQECQDRDSICASTEGFGPDGWYYDEAENDFWAVWRALATSYRLDPTRTVMSGYSMGGWASYKLTLAHPDLFSQAMPLEGPPDCGIQVLALNGHTISLPAGAQQHDHCGAEGVTSPLLGNARWVPYVVTQGGVDELVPAPSNVQQTDDMAALGDRYTLFFLPADDHLVYATQDRFAGIVRALGHRIPQVRRNPGTIVYDWYPELDVPRLGIGTTTAYWITQMSAASTGNGVIAGVYARSYAIRDRAVSVDHHGPSLVTTPLPALRSSLTWRLGARPPARDLLVLRLQDLGSLTIDAARAGLRDPALQVTTSTPVTLVLTHLPGGRRMVVHIPAGGYASGSSQPANG